MKYPQRLSLQSLSRFGKVLAGSAMAAAMGCGSTETEAEGPPQAPGDQTLGLVAVLNTADLPDRCAPADQTWEIPLPCDGEMSCDLSTYADPDDFWIQHVLYADMKKYPSFILFQHATDYYSRREELLGKLYDAAQKVPEADKALAFENLSSSYVYLGEFEKMIAVFAPGGPLEAVTGTDPYVTFDLAHAYFRLGRYEESHPYALRAHRWLPGFDTKWQLMLTETYLYGDDLYTKWSKDQYVVHHILESFPERDARNLPFEEASADLGMTDAERYGGYGSVAWADFDGDGWDDLVFERKLFPFRVYRNVAGKKLEAVPDERMGGKACSHVFTAVADADDDGRLDLTRNCCNYDSTGDLIQLKNVSEPETGIAFTDVTADVGLVRDLENVPNAGLGMNVNHCDFDLDGDLDVLAADFSAPARIYRSEGGMKYTEVGAEIGIVTPGNAVDYGGLGLSCGDLDNDGYPEIFAQGWGWRRLYHNQKNGTFKDVTAKSGIDAGRAVKGYVNFTFDYNNDGRIDLFAGAFVTSDQTQLGVEKLCGCHKLLTEEGYTDQQWSQSSTFYRNDGDFTFTNMGQYAKFVPFGAMGANFTDWNNDEWVDIVIASGGPYTQQAEPFQFYENKRGTGYFPNRTPWTATGLWGKGHGTAFGDYDHDGDMDVALNSGGFQPGDQWPGSVLKNIAKAGHWLGIKLKATRPGTNKSAIGARVEIRYGDGRLQVRELWPSIGFASTNSMNLHFGLGVHEKIDSVTVRWPNQDLLTHTVKDVAVDQMVEIDEASGSAKTLWTAPRKGALE